MNLFDKVLDFSAKAFGSGLKMTAGKHGHNRFDERFAKDVTAVLGSLLESKGARNVENDSADEAASRSFDLAIVTISGPGLRLRLIRVRQELGLWLSSADAEMPWTDVNRLVMVPENRERDEPVHSWNAEDLPRIGMFLEKYWTRLTDLAVRKALK